MPSDEPTKLSIDNAPTPQISAEGERAKTNIANARAKRNLGTVSANQLSNPVDTVTVPQPQVSSIPPQSGQLVTNITRDNAGFIAAQTEEAKQVKDLQNQFGALNDQGSLSDLFNTTRDQFGGGSDSLKELKDIQLQLTDMDTKSGLNKVNIESGGQGAMQGQRSLTQEDREAAVRSAGLAARASVIQGNIQTANAAAKSAVDIAYQDRTLKSTNLLNQISMVQDKVDEQTAQLLETEKRGYEADLAAVKELKDATQNAIVSGASQAEVSQLMDSTVDDATKLALAQTITARGAGEMRNLDIAQSRASINASNASTRSSNASAALNERALLDQEKAVEEGVLTPEQASLATDLRKERNGLQEVKDAKDLEGGFVGLISALDQENGVGDISAINSFQRLAVDPGVAVREGDVALLQSAQSFGDEALLRAQGLMVGDKLTPEARTQMRNLSAQIYDSRVGFVEDNTAQLRTIAQENGIDYNKYVGKSFVDSATLLNNLNKVVFEVVTPTSTGITFEDGTEFVLPNP